MKKKLISIILSLSMFLSLIPSIALADTNTVTLDVDPSPKVEVALAVGDTKVDYSTFETDLKNALIGKGIADDNIAISAIEAQSSNTSNNFKWWTYDHTISGGTQVIDNVNNIYVEPISGQASNDYNLKDRHIVTTNNGATMDLYGYGSSGYKDFNFLPNFQSTKKVIEFTVEELSAYDALDGAGFLINTSITGTYPNQVINGYLLFFQYNGGGKGNQIKIFELKNVNSYNLHQNPSGYTFESSIPGATLLGTAEYSTAKYKKFKIEVLPTAVKLWFAAGADNSIFNTTLGDSNLVTWSNSITSYPLTAQYDTVGNSSVFRGGYGPLISYRSHNCGQLTYFQLSNLSMTQDYVSSLTEIIREPNWHDSHSSFLVNLNESDIADFSKEYTTAEIINRLSDGDITYIGWCGNKNANASQIFTTQLGGGALVNVDDTVTDTYTKQIDAIADAIVKKINEEKSAIANTFLVEDQFSFSTVGATLNDGEWSVGYSTNGYGIEETVNAYADLATASFAAPGYYRIYHGDTSTFVEQIRIHESPVSAFTLSSSTSGITVGNKSYDPEFCSDRSSATGSTNDGIQTSTFEYMNLKDASPSWITTAPSSLTETDVWLVRLTVADNDGATTNMVKQVSLNSTAAAPYNSFTLSDTSLVKGIAESVSLDIIDRSYSLNGTDTVTASYTVKDSSGNTVTTFTLNSGGTKNLVVTDYVNGTYSVSMNATATSGSSTSEASPTVSRTFKVINGYAVSYNANEGSGAPSNQVKIDNQNLTLASTAPTRSGFIFKYWIDGSGNRYSPGTSYTGNAALTLTAQWEAIPTLILSNKTAVYNGEILAIDTATVTGATVDEVRYSYYSDTNCTLAASPINAGTYYVKASVTSTPNHASASSNVATLIISPTTITIDVNDKTVNYTGNNIEIDAAAISGVNSSYITTGITYTYFTDVSCSTLTTPANSGALNNGGAPKYAGKYYVKATIASSDNYNAATTDAPATLIIKATNDSGLSIGENQTKEYGDESFQLSATGGSGTGAVTFTSSTPSSASVTNDGYVTINAVGTTTITATKASDGNYEAQSTSITITVEQKNVSYTIADFEKTYSGSSQNVNVIPSVSTLVAGTDFTVTYKKDNKVVVNPIENGSYEIIVSTNNNNYIGSAIGTMIITSKGQSELHITGVPNYNIQYKDTFSLTANGGSGTGAITWAVTSGKATIDSDTGLVEVTGTGAVTITATKSSDNNHNIQLATVSFTATPKFITVTADAITRNYEAGNKNVTVKLNTGETGLEASYDTATVLTDNAGTGKEVTVSGVSLKNPNYTLASTTIFTTVTINSVSSGGITIEGQPSDIDGQPSNITFGDEDFRLSTDSAGTGKVIWDSADSDVAIVDSSTGVVTIKGVGSTKITATKLSDGNYNEQSTFIEITVDPKEVTYSITNNTKPYNGLAQYANVTPSVESLIEGVDYIVTYSLKENAIVNPVEEVKENAIVNPVEEVKENAIVNPVEEVKENAIVNPVEEVKENAVVNPVEEVKETPSVNLTEAVKADDVVNSTGADEENAVTYSIKTNAGVDLTQTIEAGEYNITIETINKNYKGASTEGILTIQSIDQNYTLEIGGLPEYIEYEDTFALYANGGNGTGAITWAVTSGNANIDESTGLVEVTGIGAVTITATKAGDGNYKDQIESVTFTTNKKQISLAISNTNKTYNGSVQDVTVTGTATKNSTHEEIMKVSYLMQTDISQTDFRNIGTYNVSVDINEDYKDLYVLDRGYNEVAFIGKANLIITADNKVRVYGEVNPAFTLNYNLLGTDETSSFKEPIISCTADKNSSVGDYAIKLSYDGNNVNNNYNIKLVDGKLSITSREPAPISNSGGSGGAGGAYTADKTIKVAGVTGTLFENTDLIKADADMKNAFNKSVEIRITEDSQAYQMNFNNMDIDKEYKMYPFDISLYEKGSNNKIQPNNGYNVTITLPLPKELWDSRDNASVVYESDGKAVMLPSKLIQNNGVWCIEFNAVHFSPYAIVVKNNNTWVNPFTDVNTNDWFYDALSYVNSADMMSGTSATTFEPNIGTTRGMIVTIVHRLAGSPTSLKASSFEDVEKGMWYSEAIEWASDNGIVHGYDAKTFGPNDNITREQMVTILHNYANYMKYDMNYTGNLSAFEDSNDISLYANTSMNWAVDKGIVSGTTATKLTPKGKATRGQVAAILMKFMENIAK